MVSSAASRRDRASRRRMASACWGVHGGAAHRVAAVRILGMAAAVASRVARDAQDNLEEPGARAVPAVLELVEAPVGDDEDLLRAVLHVGLVHAEAAQVAPHEVDVRVVEGAEAPRARLGRRARHRHRDRTQATAASAGCGAARTPGEVTSEEWPRGVTSVTACPRRRRARAAPRRGGGARMRRSGPRTSSVGG